MWVGTREKLYWNSNVSWNCILCLMFIYCFGLYVHTRTNFSFLPATSTRCRKWCLLVCMYVRCRYIICCSIKATMLPIRCTYICTFNIYASYTSLNMLFIQKHIHIITGTNNNNNKNMLRIQCFENSSFFFHPICESM